MPVHGRRSHVRRANVTACTRCQKRKQRCDQNIPSCSNCLRANVACVSTDIDGRVAPRSYLASLEDRIAFLENKLVSHGITDYDSPTNTATSVQSDDHETPDFPTPQTENPKFSSSQSYASIASPFQLLSSSSQLPPVVLPIIRNFKITDPNTAEAQALYGGSPYEAAVEVPTKDIAVRLGDAYFEHCDFFSPVLEKSDFLELLESLYSLNNEGLVQEKFRAFMVFAIATRLLNRTDPAFPTMRSEAYHASAMLMISKDPSLTAIYSPRLESLENLILMVQYACFCSDVSSAWYLIGLTSRLVIDLGLHDERANQELDTDSINKKRWLFWAVYTFDRNLCVVVNRPFSIPDEVINVPLPINNNHSTSKLFAIHLIKFRQLESEVQTTLHQQAPSNGASLDYVSWREDFRSRLIDWRYTVPIHENSSALAPIEVFDGLVDNTLVLLYLPSPYIPSLDEDGLALLVGAAARNIELYKLCFKEGKLRFYWRVIPHLYRSGAALVYCARVIATQPIPSFSFNEIKTSISTCSNVLWGLVERHPAAKEFRDTFDAIAAPVLNTSQPDQVPFSHPDFVSEILIITHTAKLDPFF